MAVPNQNLTKKQAEKKRISLHGLASDLLAQYSDLAARYGAVGKEVPQEQSDKMTELMDHYKNIKALIDDLTVQYNLAPLGGKKNKYKSKSNATQVKVGKYANVKGSKEVLYVSDYSHMSLGALSKHIAKHLGMSKLYVLNPRENLMFLFVVMMEQKDLKDKGLICIQDSLVYQEWFSNKVYKELLCIILGQIKNDIREVTPKNLVVLLTDMLTLNRFKRSYKKLKDDYFGGSTLVE